MDQVHRSGTHDSKDQAENLRMMVQGMKGKEPKNRPVDEQDPAAEAFHPDSSSADHDDVATVGADSGQAEENPAHHEEKAEDMMEQEANVLENGATTEHEESGPKAAGEEGETSGLASGDEPEARGAETGEADELIDEAYLNQVIEELCLSKAEEFALLGYEGVTGKDIWDFVSEKYVQTGFPPLHRLINDILSLKPTQYMNWLTLSAYKGKLFHE